MQVGRFEVKQKEKREKKRERKTKSSQSQVSFVSSRSTCMYIHI